MFLPKKNFTFFLRNRKSIKMSKRFMNIHNPKWNSKYLESDSSLSKKECVKLRRNMLNLKKSKKRLFKKSKKK